MSIRIPRTFKFDKDISPSEYEQFINPEDLINIADEAIRHEFTHYRSTNRKEIVQEQRKRKIPPNNRFNTQQQKMKQSNSLNKIEKKNEVNEQNQNKVKKKWIPTSEIWKNPQQKSKLSQTMISFFQNQQNQQYPSNSESQRKIQINIDSEPQKNIQTPVQAQNSNKEEGQFFGKITPNHYQSSLKKEKQFQELSTAFQTPHGDRAQTPQNVSQVLFSSQKKQFSQFNQFFHNKTQESQKSSNQLQQQEQQQTSYYKPIHCLKATTESDAKEKNQEQKDDISLNRQLKQHVKKAGKFDFHRDDSVKQIISKKRAQNNTPQERTQLALKKPYKQTTSLIPPVGFNEKDFIKLEEKIQEQQQYQESYQEKQNQLKKQNKEEPLVNYEQRFVAKNMTELRNQRKAYRIDVTNQLSYANPQQPDFPNRRPLYIQRATSASNLNNTKKQSKSQSLHAFATTGYNNKTKSEWTKPKSLNNSPSKYRATFHYQSPLQIEKERETLINKCGENNQKIERKQQNWSQLGIFDSEVNSIRADSLKLAKNQRELNNFLEKTKYIQPQQDYGVRPEKGESLLNFMDKLFKNPNATIKEFKLTKDEEFHQNRIKKMKKHGVIPISHFKRYDKDNNANQN